MNQCWQISIFIYFVQH